MLTPLSAPVDAALALEARIHYARSERELEAALDGIQPALDAGRLSQAQSEEQVREDFRRTRGRP